MRNIINISLPTPMVKEVRENVKQGGYASISEYFREMLRLFRGMTKQPTYTRQMPKLSTKEQELLIRAKKKIDAINNDMLNSKGLTAKEADIAAQAGIIDPKQKYFWLEDWQKSEREAEKEILEGRTEIFNTQEEFLKSLQTI